MCVYVCERGSKDQNKGQAPLLQRESAGRGGGEQEQREIEVELIKGHLNRQSMLEIKVSAPGLRLPNVSWESDTETRGDPATVLPVRAAYASRADSRL